jgi:metal-responsive CopG/Arc/MetJ family transcriptional regulator
MPSTNPRINVVLEKPLYLKVERMAKKDGVSLSLKVRDLIKEALKYDEDAILYRIAKMRDKTFSKSRALTHEQVWAHLKKS